MHMQVMRFATTRNSGTQILYRYCTKCETFQFALPAGNLHVFTQENESRARSQLSAGQVFDTI